MFKFLAPQSSTINRCTPVPPGPVLQQHPSPAEGSVPVGGPWMEEDDVGEGAGRQAPRYPAAAQQDRSREPAGQAGGVSQ